MIINKMKTDATETSTDEHKNEGFLKSAWHNLTGQHRNLDKDEPKTDEDEKKKGSGSG